MGEWPESSEELARLQEALGRAAPPLWRPGPDELSIGGCLVCFERGPSGPGRKGEQSWAGAAVVRGSSVIASAVATGQAGRGYEAGLLALREGRLLEAAVRALDGQPDVLLVDATGRDHPRRAALALHLGAVLDVPTVGVTHRPLLATGEWPPDATGAASPLRVDDEIVGYWLRTRAGTRPLAVHAAWRTEPDTALAVVLASLGDNRTPEPLRAARTLSRSVRAQK